MLKQLAVKEMQTDMFVETSTAPERKSAVKLWTEEKSGNRTYYPWFDWLRLALASIVLLSHQGLIRMWPQAGDFAVQVFFAMSGWLIGGLLFKLPKEQLPHFYFGRALRIWCPYFLALLLLVTASLLRDPVTPKWSEFVFYKATFVYNLFGSHQSAQHRTEMPLAGTGSHFWSVNAEEQFYLLAPIVMVLIPWRVGRSVFIWIAIALLAWLTHTYASIAFGVLAAVIVSTYGAIHAYHWSRIIAGLVVAASAVGLALGANYEMVAPVCAIAMVLLLAIHGNQHPWGAVAGGMSYPLYLNAWIAVFVVNAVFRRFGLTSPFVQQALILLLSLALAAILYWHVDRKIMASRPRLYTPRLARVTMTIAYGAVLVGVCIGLILRYRSG
jgi:peptidoglycan/LPS O-acetylase OafA/YrhL